MIKTYTSPRGIEKLVSASCPVCGNNRARKAINVSGALFVKCMDCSMVYQNPVPVFEDLTKRYAEDYFTYECENEENFFSLMQLGLQDIGLDAIDRSMYPSPRFLDIGCATGMLLAHMKEKGFTVVGVDICPESASYGIDKRGVPIFVGTLEDARFPDCHFSIIHFSHLIEHVPEPRAFLAEVYRILAPRGIALITTPNVLGFQARLFGKNWRSAIPDHLHLFSKKTLKRILSETGFAVEKNVTWGGIAKGAAPDAIKVPLDFLAKKFGFGDVMLFLARKPEETTEAQSVIRDIKE